MSMTKHINKLNKLFPKINAVCSSGFNGQKGGIWFRQEGEYHTDDMPYFNYWSNSNQVHPAVEAALTKMGLFAEPNDPGTWFAWEA